MLGRTMKRITIIGDGGWGTTLAVYLTKRGYTVTLWGAFPENIRQIQQTRFNAKFLPGIRIPEGITLTDNLPRALQDTELLVLAVPSQHIRKVLLELKKIFDRKIPILSVIKGIEIKSRLRVSQIITQILGPVHMAVLSGPTIANEVARSIPTTAVIASHNLKLAKKLQTIFNSDSFRIYTNTDVAGVELGGSLKNIIAIACGVCDGLGFGTNAKAAILTRGLAEIVRLGKALGAQQTTFYGLTGLGDLVTTCVSKDSRNRSLGEQLGRGYTIDEIMTKTSTVAEGVPTVKAVVRLAKKHGIDMPICTEIHNIIYRNKKPLQAVYALMGRKTKPE